MRIQMEQLSLDHVKQYKVQLPDEVSKISVTRDKIIEFTLEANQVIVYVRTRETAEMLHKSLAEYDLKVTTIHVDLTRQERDEIIDLFNREYTRILITTDVLAHGIDQSEVGLVVNYDLGMITDSSSEEEEEEEAHTDIDTAIYLNRFCSKGAVFNLLCGNTDNMIMERIEKQLNYGVTEVPSWTNIQDFRVAMKAAGLL